MKKKRLYNLQLQTPLGECEAAADTMPGLVEITPRGLLGEAIEPTKLNPYDNMDIVSRDLWTAFLEYAKGCQRSRHSNISRAGCELGLMRCYLQNKTVEETVLFLKDSYGLETSKSAVGRYWKVLNEIGPDFKARL